MIVVFVTLVSASVLGGTEAMDETRMDTSTDNLHVILEPYLYGERFSDTIFVLHVPEFAFPGCLGICCLDCIPRRRQESILSLPEV